MNSKAKEINRWATNFMYTLRQTLKTEKLNFVFNKCSNKFGIACNNRIFVRSATPFAFLETDNRFNAQFEKLVNAHWLLSPVEIWTRIEVYAVDNIIYFAKLTDLATDICDHYCITSAKHCSDKILIEESVCNQARGNFVRIPTVLDAKVSSKHIRVLIKFGEGAELKLDNCINHMYIQFKRLSPKVKAPVCATEGSVGYDLFRRYSDQYLRKDVLSYLSI